MLLNAAMKLYVFNFQSESYQIVTTEECRYDHSKPMAVEDSNNRSYERTPEEIEQCKEERKAENSLRFEQRKKEGMVDGLAMLLVGIPFWYIFRKKKETKK